MPRYHFNVHDGHSTSDTDGTDLASALHARLEAVRLAGRILHDEAKHVMLADEWRMEVTDPAGLILFRIDVLLRASAAVGEHCARDAGRLPAQ